MAANWTTGAWRSGGVAEWIDLPSNTAFISVAFTWMLEEARARAMVRRAEGFHVRAGGPGTFTRPHYLEDVAELGGAPPAEALIHHNPMATIASRGCTVGCWFCIVPKMEGRTFTLLPDFEPRPVLCDNNLSALPADFQDHIVARYQAKGVPLLDANSGFEPRTFDEQVLARWRPINRGPWRFAYDDAGDGPHVARVMAMLDRAGVPSRRRQVYTMIGNEPFEACMHRIRQVIGWGGEPYAQPFIKLNALEKQPHVRHDWTRDQLRRVTRWVNGRYWKYVPYERYDPSARTDRLPPLSQLALPGIARQAGLGQPAVMAGSRPATTSACKAE